LAQAAQQSETRNALRRETLDSAQKALQYAKPIIADHSYFMALQPAWIKLRIFLQLLCHLAAEKLVMRSNVNKAFSY